MLPSKATKAAIRLSRAAANRAAMPPQLKPTTATLDIFVSGSECAYPMRNEVSRARVLIPARSAVMLELRSPKFGLAMTTYPLLARYSQRSAFSHGIGTDE